MQNSKLSWKKAIKIIGNILVVISIIFIIKRIISMNLDYDELFSLHNVLCLLPLFVVFTIQVLASFFPWWIITISMTSIKVSAWEMCVSFAKANIMKYIPGNVFQYVGRAEIAEKNKSVNITIIAASLIIETAATVLSAVIVGAVGVSEYTIRLLQEKKSLLILFLTLCAAMLILICIFRKKIQALLKKKNIVITWKLAEGFLLALAFLTLSQIIGGVMLTIIMQIISGKSYFPQAKTICGAYAISWVIGYVTPGASGGIGVREAILYMLLKNFASSDIVMMSAIILRFLNIVSDLSAYAITRIINRKYEKV